MEKDLIYLETYILQQDMRIRMPKAILENLNAEKGKTKFKIYMNKNTNEEMNLDEYDSLFRFEDDVNLELILLNCKNFVYCYDFGDDWRVDIQVENVTAAQVEGVPVILEFGGGMAKDDCGGAEVLMQMRKRKTNLIELNLILEEMFDR